VSAGAPATGKQARAGLGGTGRLADDLFLMAHNDVSGRPYLQPRAAGLGLAGALLAELVLAGSIQVRPRSLVAVSDAAPQDGLARFVLGLVVSEREQHPAGDWLQFVGRTAAVNVAGRLGEAGYLTRVCSRRPWRGQRWVPVDSDCAFMPLTRARASLDPSRPVTAAGAVLAGLGAACGLGPRLLAYAPPGGSRSPEEAAAVLAPGLRYLIAQTQAAVDSAVLAHRV
jgi:hypothetical protein